MDRAVLHEHGIHEALSECGGVGGLSYTLRSVPLLLEIAREMERRCPDAWLLNITNPLPRVLTAVTHTTSIRSAGFCNVAHGGGRGLYDNVAELVGRPADQIEVISGGLNHFSWLLAVRDTASGKDLMPYVQQAMQRGAWSDKPLTQECWRRYGVLPLPGDSHIGEFLPFNTQEFHTHLPDENERAARRDLLLAVADGKEPWQHLMEGRSWERPGIAASALATGASLHLDMVNLPNNSRVPNLPDDAIVETPAEIVDGELRAATLGPLPESIAELCAQVAAVHTLAARAAVTGNRALVEEVIRIDPAITNKPVALRAIKALLDVHADVLPQFRG
jgi:alpha-galactosidase